MQVTDFDGVWGAFVAAGETLGPSPGVREAWHRGRPEYAVWVLPVQDAAVQARVQAAQARLGDAIAPVRPADVHVTVHVSGFPTPAPRLDDDVLEAALGAAAEAARGATPVRLAVGPASAFRSCAILEVTDPHGDLDGLRARLHPTHPELRFAPYRPHVTVGRFVDPRPTAPIAAALAPLRDLPALHVEARLLRRVAVDPFTADAPLRAVLDVPLGARRG